MCSELEKITRILINLFIKGSQYANEKNSPNEKNEGLGSSALKVNLERTAVTIEIPEQYAPLLEVVAGHYGLQKKTSELLMELNHPLVNWEYVLKELKSISIGDFYIYNNHQDGLSALSMMLRIYFDVIKSSSSKDIKDSAITLSVRLY